MSIAQRNTKVVKRKMLQDVRGEDGVHRVVWQGQPAADVAVSNLGGEFDGAENGSR